MLLGVTGIYPAESTEGDNMSYLILGAIVALAAIVIYHNQKTAAKIVAAIEAKLKAKAEKEAKKL
jgi:hypothetical protein